MAIPISKEPLNGVWSATPSPLNDDITVDTISEMNGSAPLQAGSERPLFWQEPVGSAPGSLIGEGPPILNPCR
jgi:hypothetical protein